MSSRFHPIIALVFVLVPASCCLWKPEQPPNLVLITVDSLRFDAISQSLGAARTPNIQRLVADGTSFSYCFTHTPVSLPAHAALFSSQLPHDSRVTSNGQGVDESLPLLAEWLGKNDYRTLGAVSLATLWPPRADAEAPKSRSGKESQPHGIERGFESFETCEHEIADANELNSKVLPHFLTTTPDVPWFLFVQYSDPHEPHESCGSAKSTAQVLLDDKLIETVNTSDTTWWRHAIDVPPGRHKVTIRSEAQFELRRFDCLTSEGVLEPRFETGHEMTPAKRVVIALENGQPAALPCTLAAWIHDVPSISESRSRYKKEVEHVDEAIGELLDLLRAKDMYDNTCIVLTSDHGESLGEHGATGHLTNLYDELLRVPLIIKPPKDHPGAAGLLKSQHSIVRQIDVAPTALELIGVKPLPGAQGISILNHGERLVISETHPPEARATIFCLRDERYKMIFATDDDRFEMYDLSADTLEAENVFALQGHLHASWQTQLRNLASNSPETADARMGWRAKRSGELRALGY